MQKLKEAILFIFDYLNQKYQLSIIADIDIDRDRINILEQINLSEKDNSIANYCPEIKKYWDFEKNGKIIPDMISYGSGKKVYLECNVGHKWKTIVKDFFKHPTCPYCNGERVTPGRNDLFTEHPELVLIWSPNNTIDPKTIKSGCNSKALWYCSNCGGEYEMVIKDKVNCRGCPYCSGHRVLKGFNDLAFLFPELADEWDYEKNAPLKPSEVSKGSNKKVGWICRKGHKWDAVIAKRTKGQGCPICSGHKVLAGFNDLASLFPELADEWDYEKNFPLKPHDVSKKSHKKVLWKCRVCGHEWKTSICSRTGKKKTGCPKCSKENRIIHNAKSVIQLSLVGTVIAEYPSAMEAERQTGIKSIHKVCRGEGKTAGGFIWKYKTDKINKK